jgi:parallel beta-helix repeat protein
MEKDIGSWGDYNLFEGAMKIQKIVVFMIFTTILILAVTSFADLYYRMLFERGVFLMESRILPEEAITIFQEIIKRHPYDRYYAARSQCYIGLCYKRMGSDKAFGAFQEVITNYPDQKDVVKIAKAEMTFLPRPELLSAKESVRIAQRRIWKGNCVYGMSDLSNDGRFISYVDLETGNLRRCEIATGQTQRLADHGVTNAFAAYPKFSPDGERIAYGWKDGKGTIELRVVKIDGSQDRILLRDKGIVSIQPADWTANGEQILVSLTRSDLTTQIAFISVTDGSLRPLKELGLGWPDHLRLSPDGCYVAYGLLKDGNWPERDIFLYSIVEKEVTPLVVQPGDDLLLGWTSNSKNILFASDRAGTADAWIFSVQGGEPQQAARLVKSDIGQVNPINFTRDGVFCFEVKTKRSRVTAADRSSTEIWIIENFLPEETKTLIVPDDYPTIQAAVSAADPGDTVYVQNGLYAENIVIDKSLTLQGEDRKATILDGSQSGNVVRIAANHVVVKDLTARNGKNGIKIGSSMPIHHITLKNVIVTLNTSEGIFAKNTGGYHVIDDCIISHNHASFGIYAYQFSKSVIRNCDVFDNSSGIQAGWSWDVIIEGNKAHHNRYNGISLDSCFSSTVEKNLAYANEGAGISYEYISNHNTIKENIVYSNGWGVNNSLAWGSFGEHRIFHNDFFDNKMSHKGLSKGSAKYQYWDNGYPSGGNCWSDYKGQDTNKDGIGDRPYEVAGEACDNFPLMKPWNRIQVNVEIDPVWLSKGNREDWIAVYIELPAGLPPEDIKVSTLLLNGIVLPDRKKLFVGDHDDDGIPDMMVMLNKKGSSQILQSCKESVVTVSGRLKNGLPFEGSQSINIIGK